MSGGHAPPETFQGSGSTTTRQSGRRRHLSLPDVGQAGNTAPVGAYQPVLVDFGTPEFKPRRSRSAGGGYLLERIDLVAGPHRDVHQRLPLGLRDDDVARSLGAMLRLRPCHRA